MKKLNFISILILLSIQASAQVDGSLLIGLTPVANADIATITSPPEGAMFYNTDNQKIYLNTASGFIGIPSLDTNTIDFWSALGSTGTNPAVNFLGTTDAQDMVFRANNEERLRLSESNQTVLINGATQFNNHAFAIRANGDDVMAFQTAAGVTEWHWNLVGNGLNFAESGVTDFRMFMEQGGNIGLSTGTPSETLDVNGSLRVRTIATTVSDLDVLVTTATGVVQKRIFADFVGSQGTQGIPGNDGISVTNATINGSDELILTFSDTNTINTGVVVGADGAQGIPGNDGAAGSIGTDGLSVTNAAIDGSSDLIITLSDNSTLNAGNVGSGNISKLNFGGRWTNIDIATNLNVDDVVAPIFGVENYKDDGINLYEVNVTNDALTVKEAGRYDIRANLSISGVDGAAVIEQRTNVNARIYVDGNPVGSLSATGYIRFQANGNFQSSIHINEILELSPNNIITIVTFQGANIGEVNFSAAGESSFIINKLQ